MGIFYSLLCFSILTKHRELGFFTFSLSNHVGSHTYVDSCVCLLCVWDRQLSPTNLLQIAYNYIEPLHHKVLPSAALSKCGWINRCFSKSHYCKKRHALKINPPWSCRLWGQDELYLFSRRWWVQDVHVEADTPKKQSRRWPPPSFAGSAWSHHATLQQQKKRIHFYKCKGDSNS